MIITSNQNEVAAYGTPVDVGVFTEQEALPLPRPANWTRRSKRGYGTTAELGYLPLALAQAAAVIATQRLPYQTYLVRLRSMQVQDYLKRTAPDPYPHGTAEAILLALDAADTADQTGLCLGLMNVISLLSETGTPRTLLYAAAQDRHVTQTGAETIVPADQVDEVIGHLASASLLNFNVDGSTVSAHRLTMRVCREHQANNGNLPALGAIATRLLHTVTQSLPQPWQNRLAARDTIQQITALYEHLTPYLDGSEDQLVMDLLQLRGWAGWCLDDLGDDIQQAVTYCELVLADFERVLGENHPSTLMPRNNLAYAYAEGGAAGRGHPAVRTDPHRSRAGAGRGPPRHPDLAEQPRLRLPESGAAGRGHPAVRTDPHRSRAGAGRGRPRHPDLAEQPRVRLRGAGRLPMPSRCTNGPSPIARSG